MPWVLSPSMREDLVPGLMPARAAGVSSMGATTTSALVLARDLDAQPAELARGVDLHLLEHLGRHEDGVRIQRLQHALDGAVHELLLVHRLHVVVLHVGEHAREQLQLAVGRLVTLARGRVVTVRASDGGGEQQARGERHAPRVEEAGHGVRPFAGAAPSPVYTRPRRPPAGASAKRTRWDTSSSGRSIWGTWPKPSTTCDLRLGRQVGAVSSRGSRRAAAARCLPTASSTGIFRPRSASGARLARRGAGLGRQRLHGGRVVELAAAPRRSSIAANGGLWKSRRVSSRASAVVLHVEGAEQRRQRLGRQRGARGGHQRQRPHQLGVLRRELDGHGAAQRVAHHEGGLLTTCWQPGAQHVELAAHADWARRSTPPEKPCPGRSGASTREKRRASPKNDREKPLADPPRPCTSTTGGPLPCPFSSYMCTDWPATVTVSGLHPRATSTRRIAFCTPPIRSTGLARSLRRVERAR